MSEVRTLKPSKWARQEIMPVPRADRNMGTWSFGALWITMASQLGIFTLGASLVEAMSATDAILAVAVGNLAMVAFLMLLGDIGIEHGVNFAGYLRAPFGMLGSYLPLALRGLAGIAWFGIQTWLAATALNVATERFLGLSALPIWYFLIGIAQILLVAAGLEVMRVLVLWAAAGLTIVSCAIIYLLLAQESVNDFISHTPADPQPFLVGVVANMSYWTTVAVNLPDFTRNVRSSRSHRSFVDRNRRSIVAQLVAVPGGMLLFTMVGMVGFVFHEEPNPVYAIAATIGGVALMLTVGVVVLAQLTTNVTANGVAATYATNAIGAPKLNYAWSAVTMGVMGLLLTFPWILLDFFLTYLPMLGAVLAPIVGIMVTDYYIIRRRRVHVPALFEAQGQYRYWRGVNPAAILAWAVGAAGGMVLLDYSFFISLPVGLLTYWVLMRAWVLRFYHQAEVSVAGEKYLATTVDRDWPLKMDET